MRQTEKPYAKRLWLTALLACGVVTSFAAPKPDELRQALAAASPADRPRLLVELSAAIEADDTNRAWDYAQQARKEAASPADEIRADTRIAAIHRRRGAYVDALNLAQSALDRATALGDARLRAEAMLIVAFTQVSLANFSAALESFRTLTPLAEAQGDPLLLARVYSTLGIAYADAEQIDRARQAYETALDYANKSGDQRMAASLLNNLGGTAIESDNAPLARSYHERALALRMSLGGDARGVADSLQNLGHVAMMEDKPLEAISYFERALALYAPLGLKRNIVNAQTAYAKALIELGRLDEVSAHLDVARQYAEELKSPTILVRVYRTTAAYHEARSDFKTALEFERKLAAATDAALGEKSRQRIDALQARYDAERRQHEIDLLRRNEQLKEAELATVRWQRYNLALALFGVLALAGTIITLQRLRQRAEKRLHDETRAGRAAAEAANALKTRLLHITSHDIRGPLGNVLHMAGELRAELPGGPTDVRLDVIQHEAENVMALAQDLLDSAALESGALVLHIGPLDLADIVHAVVGRLEWRADLKRQSLVFAPPIPGAGLIEGDGARLNQVVVNLVSNALKYSPAGKAVRLELVRTETVVRLHVIDQGMGITPEDQARLFVPFARLSNRPQGGESSHGLGLSIAHDLVRLHGGRLTVQSTPGQGSTFTVELPIMRPSRPVV